MFLSFLPVPKGLRIKKLQEIAFLSFEKRPEKTREKPETQPKKTVNFLHFLPRCSHGATFFASLAWRRCPPLLDWLRWPSTPRAGCSGERHRRPRQRKRPVWCRCIKACPCCDRWEKHGKVGITRWFLVEYIHIPIILHTLYIYIYIYMYNISSHFHFVNSFCHVSFRGWRPHGTGAAHRTAAGR